MRATGYIPGNTYDNQQGQKYFFATLFHKQYF
jgi:hypothetical protein